MVHFLEKVLVGCAFALAVLLMWATIASGPAFSRFDQGVLPYTGPRPPITFQITLGRPDDIKDACEILTGTRHNACAKFKTEKSLCWVFAPWPEDRFDRYRFDLLEHEFGHCVSGAWHG